MTFLAFLTSFYLLISLLTWHRPLWVDGKDMSWDELVPYLDIPDCDEKDLPAILAIARFWVAMSWPQLVLIKLRGQ